MQVKEGALIAKARKASGYSQLEIAKKLGYSHAQFISNIERDHALLPVRKFRALTRLVGARPVRKLIELRVASFRSRLEKELE